MSDKYYKYFSSEKYNKKEKEELIHKLVNRYLNKSSVDKFLIEGLRGTDLFEIISNYLFDKDDISWSEAKKRFILRNIIEQGMDIEFQPGIRNENDYYNNAIREYNNQAGPSNQVVSIKKRSLNYLFDKENEKRIKLIEKNVHLQSEDCPICLDLLNSDICMINPCGHKFHCSCIQKSRKFKNICPFCRTDIEELIRLPDLPSPPQPEPSGSTTTDGTTTLREIGEPEVNSYGSSFKSDLRYLKSLSTKARKVGR